MRQQKKINDYCWGKNSEQSLVFGCKIPRHFYVVKGCGESDISHHTGSFHRALKDAGIERHNIITYSSVLPQEAEQVAKPNYYHHGSVMETIMARMDVEKGERATAGLIYGWFYDRTRGEKRDGYVCEYMGKDSVKDAKGRLECMIQELLEVDPLSQRYDFKSKIVTKSFIPKKKYGTALAAICFMDYIYPLVK